MSNEEKIKILRAAGFEDFDMLKKQTGDLTRFLHCSKRSESYWRDADKTIENLIRDANL